NAGGVGESCNLARLRAEIGDIANAKAHFVRCENGTRTNLSDVGYAALWQHWAVSRLERTRMAMLLVEGKLTEAEAAARRELSEAELDIPLVAARQRAGYKGSAANRLFVLNVRDNSERRLADVLVMRGKLAEAEIAARNALRSLLSRNGLYFRATVAALIRLA